MSDPVTFLASLPPIMSAIRIGQDGARLQLEIPATEAAAIQQLCQMHGKVLSVAVVVADEPPADRTVERDPRARTEKLK